MRVFYLNPPEAELISESQLTALWIHYSTREQVSITESTFRRFKGSQRRKKLLLKLQLIVNHELSSVSLHDRQQIQ